MASQAFTIFVIVLYALPPIKTQEKRTKLDFLKADILKHVIEKENNNEETDTALEILQFILGNKEGNSQAEWQVAKALIREDNKALYKSSEDEIDDFIGFYEDNLYDYPEDGDEFEYPDLFIGDEEVDYSNVFEYSDLFTSDGDGDEYYQELETDYNSSNSESDQYNEDPETDFESEEYNYDYEYEYSPETCSADSDSLSNDTEVRVVESVPYIMTSVDSLSSATIVMQRISEIDDKVNLVCNFSSSSAGLLSDSGCLPEIYLVSGRTTCSSLPQTVSATKLAEIHQAGSGEALLDISWSELNDTCVIIVKKVDCDSGDIIETRNTRQQSCSVIKSAGVTRTFSSLSLSGFLVLLSGSSVFLKVLSSATVTSSAVTLPVYDGLTVTSYDKWGTLPFLQLPGLNSTHAIILVLFLMASYFLGAYVLIQYPNIAGTKRRIASQKKKVSISGNQFLHNYSQWGDKIFDIVDEGLYQQEKVFNNLMGIYFRRNKNF